MSNAGTILRVDLTDSKIEKEPTSSYVHDYVGGLNIGTKILWDGVPPEITGTDPKNMLIFSTGPLTGTLLGNKCVVIAKSPIFPNQTIGNAGMGGHFPSEMKFAGYDHIVISGKAEEPVYLFINNDKVEIRAAKHLWGLDVADTQTMIKEELRDPDVQIACIGPAGENLIAFSLILHDVEHTASRAGHGAVMGSKNLKAVAVRGTKGLKVANPEAFMALWDEYYKNHTIGGPKRRGVGFFQDIPQVGSGPQYDFYVNRDLAAWGNFDSYVVPTRKKEEYMYDFNDKYKVGPMGCTFCPAQCHMNYDVDGIGGGAICMLHIGFHWHVKNLDLKIWWRTSQLAQRYGMEIVSIAGITSWLMDLYERGVITAADTDGVPMEWGSEEACMAVIEKTARREGFGELLADGIIHAAQRIGKDSLSRAMFYRNQPVHAGSYPMGAGAAIYGIPSASELSYVAPQIDFDATYPIYARGWGVSDEEAKKIAYEWTSDFAEEVTGDRDSWKEDNYEKYADFAVANEALIAAMDISGHCDWMSHRLVYAGAQFKIEDVVRAISATTGSDCTAEMLVNAHRRRRLLELAYAQLCYRAIGEEEEICVRGLEPRPDGLFKGYKIDVEKLPQVMAKYYDLMGIDMDTMLPKRKELERLGMKDVADMLENLEQTPAPPEPEEALKEVTSKKGTKKREQKKPTPTETVEHSASVGISWAHNVHYDTEDTVWTMKVIGEETIDGIDTYITETSFDKKPKRGIYVAQMDKDLTSKFKRMSTWLSKSTLQPVKNESAFAIMGMTIRTKTTFAFDGPCGAPLSVGKTWSYEQVSTPSMGDPTTKTWNVEVVGMEEVTVPAGTYNCYKVVHTAEDGTRTEWWSADGGLLTPVKMVDKASWSATETQELAYYKG